MSHRQELFVECRITIAYHPLLARLLNDDIKKATTVVQQQEENLQVPMHIIRNRAIIILHLQQLESPQQECTWMN